MKVITIKGSNKVYSSNVYLCLGDWNRIEDVNTLIDVGNDPLRIDKIEACPSGIGKKRVERVILTHNHSDHMGILPLVREAFKPEVCAFSPFFDSAARVLRDGDTVRIADRVCEIIHFPGHSDDSICVYCKEEGILFVGDTPVVIQSGGGSYGKRFIDTLHALCRKNIQAIYFGHGEPLLVNAKQAMLSSLTRIMEGGATIERSMYGQAYGK
jgi:glyoxylase-like metal-dependent hydrolase (beta-lactamase superfamily II)